ncbi:DUF2059 domain-containing protein [Sphingomonas sp.]|jgi:hypothetical protein|uniref:DUF2059 domain-containing protein n=1 Tax=Sphingomonas sp. TaxID=28214 RepID=UPI002E363051|nr:DUF2059 domain-containing protein [Sphingomonas sp.]HEX4695506.1 DUF2059 domain-containing protein [Sphingomonas sp.]
MTKKTMIVVVALLTATPVLAQTPPPPPAASAAVDPAKLAIARDVINVVLPPDQRDKMFASILDTTMRNMMAGAMQGSGVAEEIKDNPKVQAVFERFVERQRSFAMADLRAAMPDLVEAYARAYARMFSLDDLQAIRTFVQTPAGAHFVQRGSTMLADPDVSAWQRRLTAQGAARQQVELEKLKAELLSVRTAAPGKT